MGVEILLRWLANGEVSAQWLCIEGGLAGGFAEADMHSLARESITMGEGLAFGPAMAMTVGAFSPWGVVVFSVLSHGFFR
ncbi:hypothetical protein OsJ_23953 [Oryza sativa Japonica Group]|uniref:Uncharacterized protein n=1 Tax=Oryza sativa subsp. japonica TaxID=39947 RepID=Q8H365_ORYSJ|nr:hypothetical protein OsJ_23953 [Oryza sativa Japonica Group]BAC20856.1 hypothetical protein [Oryza sativa Japonica Group]